MAPRLLAYHEPLASESRFRPRPALGAGASIRPGEAAVLLASGIAAGVLTVFWTKGMQLPGHNILRVILPMGLGLAMVPRRGSGLLMGLGAASTVLVCGLAGAVGAGLGAFTGLVLIGLLLDAALAGVRDGRSIYIRFAAAGLTANLIALAVRAAAKYAAVGEAAKKPLALWWPQAVVLYPLFGLAAGLLAAWLFFRFRRVPSEVEKTAD